MGSLSIWHWMIVLIIVLLIFGTKKLRNLGADLGGAVKGFKDGMREATSAEQAADAVPPAVPPSAPTSPPPQQVNVGQTIEGEVREKTRS